MRIVLLPAVVRTYIFWTIEYLTEVVHSFLLACRMFADACILHIPIYSFFIWKEYMEDHRIRQASQQFLFPELELSTKLIIKRRHYLFDILEKIKFKLQTARNNIGIRIFYILYYVHCVICTMFWELLKVPQIY